MIQFATDRQTERRWAIKFFLSARGFADEAALYRDPGSPLGPFLPLVRNITGTDDSNPLAPAADALTGYIADSHGRPLPPCIVMERGESLDIWRMRNAQDGIDVFTALQVRTACTLICTCMHSCMHSVSMSHCLRRAQRRCT